MMSVYESIMQGLTEAIAYEKGEQTAHSTCVTTQKINHAR